MTARLPAAVVARRPVSDLARRPRAHNVPIARRIICLSLAERILGTFVRSPHLLHRSDPKGPENKQMAQRR